MANSLLVGSKRLGGRPRAVTAAGDRVWIASAASAESHCGGTLTLVWTGRFASTDPAFVLETDRQSTRLAYDTLVTDQASAGAAGLRLLPDLAVAVPRPANGGTLYRFRLHPDIRYSDGSLVRAHDFRRAIERLFPRGLDGRELLDRVDRRPRLQSATAHMPASAWHRDR